MGHGNTSCDPHLHQSHQATNAPLPHAKRLPQGGYVLTAFAVSWVPVPTWAVADFYDRQRQDRERDYPSPACSLITVRASLSSRSPANFECRKWSTYASGHGNVTVRGSRSGARRVAQNR